MRLVTCRPRGLDGPTIAAQVEGTSAVLLPWPDVGAALVAAENAGVPVDELVSAVVEPDTERRPLADIALMPVVPLPGKIVCVGLNYGPHILEMGHPEPTHPTLFVKWADALIGPHDDLVIPPEVELLDWEVELVVVVGRTVRRADEAAAGAAIAGFTVGNDVSARDWQRRTSEFLQGKTWEGTTPIGPALVTVDELGPRPDLAVTCAVSGTTMQQARTSELIFDPPTLVSYISTFTTLRPGDLVFTGTPGGVGAARTPPIGLVDGDQLTTSIEILGTMENRCVAG